MYQWRANARMRQRMRGMNLNPCILRRLEDAFLHVAAHLKCVVIKCLLLYALAPRLLAQ